MHYGTENDYQFVMFDVMHFRFFVLKIWTVVSHYLNKLRKREEVSEEHQ
jgi:hypothetical protein